MAIGSRARTGLFIAAVAALVAVGLWLRATALRVPFLLDDYWLLAARRGLFPRPRAAWDLYAYAFDRPAEHQALLAAGALPWWSHPHVRFAVLRPLASLLIALDDALAPGNARVAHAHSLLWWAAAAVAFAWLLRRRVPAVLTLLALALFAFDEATVLPTVWVANRTALVSLTFGLVALGGYDAWATGRRRAWAWVAGLAFALALAGGEYGLAVLAYVIALEALHPGTWPTRLRRVVPAALPALAYLGVYVARGYGAHGLDGYADPLGEPRRFLALAPTRLGSLLLEMFAGVPVERWDTHRASAAAILGGVAAMAGVYALAWRASRVLPPDARRWTRAMGAGALLALLPMLGGIVTSRLTIMAGIGASVSLATIVYGAVAALRARVETWPWRALLLAGAVVLVGVHAGVVPRRWYAQLQASERATRGVTPGILRSPAAREMRPETRVLVLAAASPEVLTYAPTMWSLAPGGRTPMPRAWWVASMVPGPQLLVRRTPEVLELRALSADMLTAPFEQLWREPGTPLHVGDTVQAGGLRVRVREMGARGPRWLELRLDESWDSPDVRLLLPTPAGIVRVGVPAVGFVMPVPAAAIPWQAP